MSAKVRAVIYAFLTPATLAVGLVLAIAGDRIRQHRNAKRWTS